MPENREIERRKSDEIERRKDSLVQRSLEYLKEFDEQGLANVEEPDLEGWDLHRAARENRADIVRALIARGDDVNARDDDGVTPLLEAARGNSLEVARLLLEHVQMPMRRPNPAAIHPCTVQPSITLSTLHAC